MSKKDKKMVSVNEVDRVLELCKDNTYSLNWHDITVEVKSVIGLKDMLELVDNVVTSCYQDGHGYMPEMLHFALRCYVIDKYTNVSMPRNVEKKYAIVMGTDLYACVCDIIDDKQFIEIVDAIDEKISYINKNNVMRLESQLSDLSSTLEGMSEKAEELFGGASMDDIGAMMKALSENGVDEKKLVEAYMDSTKAVDA